MRQWNPRNWDASSRVLVFGEALAFLSAFFGAALRLASVDVPWLFISAAVASTFFLAWYAVDLVTRGEYPLTPRFVNRVKSIAEAVRFAEQHSIEIDLDTLAEKEDGTLSLLYKGAEADRIAWEALAGMYGEDLKQDMIRLVVQQIEREIVTSRAAIPFHKRVLRKYS